jgi:hypothetical protein
VRGPVLIGLAAALLAGGCREAWWLGPFARKPAAPPAPVTWTAVPGEAIEVIEQGHGERTIRYRVRLPAADEGAGGGGPSRLELRFREPLEGAKVHALGAGPRHHLRLIDGRRVRGDTVTVALAPFPLDDVFVEIHHHMRPTPIVAEVRLGRPVGP